MSGTGVSGPDIAPREWDQWKRLWKNVMMASAPSCNQAKAERTASADSVGREISRNSASATTPKMSIFFTPGDIIPPDSSRLGVTAYLVTALFSPASPSCLTRGARDGQSREGSHRPFRRDHQNRRRHSELTTHNTPTIPRSIGSDGYPTDSWIDTVTGRDSGSSQVLRRPAFPQPRYTRVRRRRAASGLKPSTPWHVRRISAYSTTGTLGAFGFAADTVTTFGK